PRTFDRSQRQEELALVGSQKPSPKMADPTEEIQEQAGGQMSFLEHLDELRKRLVRSVIVIILAFAVCWVFSDKIYNFLSIPIREALSEASRRQLPVEGRTGDEKVLSLASIKEGDSGRFIFDRATKVGSTV